MEKGTNNGCHLFIKGWSGYFWKLTVNGKVFVSFEYQPRSKAERVREQHNVDDSEKVDRGLHVMGWYEHYAWSGQTSVHIRKHEWVGFNIIDWWINHGWKVQKDLVSQLRSVHDKSFTFVRSTWSFWPNMGWFHSKMRADNLKMGDIYLKMGNNNQIIRISVNLRLKIYRFAINQIFSSTFHLFLGLDRLDP
jgi:hypothetical protein